MLVKLSSKGQMIIPKDIRKALNLRPGTELRIQLKGNRIVVEPVGLHSRVDALYGKYSGIDLLTEQELEHWRELHDEGLEDNEEVRA